MRIFTIVLAVTTLLPIVLKAQTRTDKLYTISGIGTSVPVGKTADVFGRKISTTLGLNYGLSNGGLFLYPKVSLHALSYRAKTPDAGFAYTAQVGRATTYLLNVGLGYRKMVGKFAFYGFAGAGGGYILTPRVRVDNAALQVEMSNQSHFMPIAEGGAGVEFSLGGLAIFTEASYMNGFEQIQARNFTTVPLTIGIKPNLSKLFNK
ncbi:autotransporter outer membrane beta-barrel domain-containing protein [Pedobacter sp. SL55]|uniref:autotransporter outer membrane beta-barrel domain-containing protein n=1 Tax=Pedobacter sp. SL55 TaxID=2995161 RepID=UPI0022704BD5|nr:autotransporter outer membrane beta-barrel domain-containing protein [Pedobacter sp. SL55]WAC40225.1 autotransporter outer membrane beta-barrel domain-containing protein [Pedobacter sp. SL55]